jgi:hypothetical protein
MRRGRGAAETTEPVEVAALADGSLADDRVPALEAEVAASPELERLLAEQRRAVDLARNAAAQVEAPASLRAAIAAHERPQRSSSRGLFVVGAAATAAAVVVAVCIALFGSGTSPDRFQVALAGTELAPSAHGDATLTKTNSGWNIDFYAEGLPRLDDGRFYEAWLKSADGNLVPIGTFNEGEDVMLWAGVSPRDFPTLTVTREQADGDQSSSGEKVLAGEIDTAG